MEPLGLAQLAKWSGFVATGTDAGYQIKMISGSGNIKIGCQSKNTYLVQFNVGSQKALGPSSCIPGYPVDGVIPGTLRRLPNSFSSQARSMPNTIAANGCVV